MLKRFWVKNRGVVKEQENQYKVYLPTEYIDIWELLNRENKLVDVIIILPESINSIDKILIRGRKAVREGDRYKIYLPKPYNELWKKLYEEEKKVDLIVVVQ